MIDVPNDSEYKRRVHMNEKTSDLIHGVENERIPPCDNGRSEGSCEIS